MTSHIPDQLTSEDSTINANDVTYGYDANGSQTLKSTAAGDTVYKWDLRGRMVGIDTNDDGTADVTYSYDSDGVRVSQSTNGDTTHYLQDKQNPTGYAKAIEDRTDAGSNGSIDATTSYILGLQVIGQADAAATYYLLLDGHGSTAALTSTNGVLVEEYAYSAFGEAIGFDASTAKTNWLFGGDGIWDAKSQMTYHLARWRDGHRFVSYDSFEADPSSPASLHKYAYAEANPLRGWDPSGEELSLTGVAVMGGISGVIAASMTAAYGYAKGWSGGEIARAALYAGAVGAGLGTLGGLAAMAAGALAVSAGTSAVVGYSAFGMAISMITLPQAINTYEKACAYGDEIDQAFAAVNVALAGTGLALSATSYAVQVANAAIGAEIAGNILWATSPNRYTFWSGRTNGIGGRLRAIELARTKGGETLEMVQARKGIRMPEYDMNNPDSVAAWDVASAQWAKNAYGTVRAIIGQTRRPGNTWERVELPILKANPKVTNITVVDPQTGAETVIFSR